MSVYAGTWVQKDGAKYLRLAVTNENGQAWGTAMGTSPAWAVYLEVRKPGATALFATITGSWEDATEAAALFNIGAAGVFDPTTEASLTWEAILLLSRGGVEARRGADNDRQPFSFTVMRWP